jgi:hypothetical protein
MRIQLALNRVLLCYSAPNGLRAIVSCFITEQNFIWCRRHSVFFRKHRIINQRTLMHGIHFKWPVSTSYLKSRWKLRLLIFTLTVPTGLICCSAAQYSWDFAWSALGVYAYTQATCTSALSIYRPRALNHFALRIRASFTRSISMGFPYFECKFKWSRGWIPDEGPLS